MKIAYFDCFSGISGDMILGALVDVGLDFDTLKSELAKLTLSVGDASEEFTLSVCEVKRRGMRGTRVDVLLGEGRDHTHRNLDDIKEIIEKSELSAKVKENSLRVFRRLAQAEASVHGTSLDEVHFHEVGAVDAIVDIVGAAIAFEQLGIEKAYTSAIAVGSGYVECQHGRLPVPAPATAELLKGFPVIQGEVQKELTTPTGAAILTTFASLLSALQKLSYLQIGYGAGKRDNPELPNLLRVCLGETAATAEADAVWVIETNIDDMSPELYGYLFDKLLSSGALDVYTTPIQMKKGRSAILLTVLAPDEAARCVEDVIFEETTTFGIRKYRAQRKKLSREEVKVRTTLGDVRVKVGKLDGETKTASPEHEDCRRIAEEKKIPLKRVYDIVMRSFHAER